MPELSAAVQALRDAQIWMRDTTNCEKVSYLARGATPLKVASTLREALQDLDPDGRDFEQRFYWAAFACAGAC